MALRKLFIRSGVVCFLLMVVLFAATVKRIDRLPVSDAPSKFDAASAHQFMTRLAKDFMPRTTHTPSRKQAALWLKKQFRQMGYEPKGMLFSEIIDGKEYTDLENVWAEKPGTKFPNEWIAVVAHYDAPETSPEGAMDDASGSAVVLELARIFSNQKTDRGLIFLLTDSEEFGAFWGAIQFSKHYEKKDQIVAALNFDFVAPEKQVAILTMPDGLKTGYTPLWLRELALDSIRSLGEVEARDFTHIVEHLQRALQIPSADQGAFLAHGIPSFNWVGQMEPFAYQMAHYHHTKHDVAEIMRPESFGTYGRAAERLVHSIDQMPSLPDNWRKGNYWKIAEHLYLEGWVATSMHILAFLPFCLLTIGRLVLVFRTRTRFQIGNIAWNEFRHLLILAGCLVLGYGVMQVLPALRIITQYESFPATQKSEILYNPNYWAFAIVIGMSLAAYWVFLRIFKEKHDDAESLEVRRAIQTGVICAVTLFALAKNSYLATLLLLPVAYFWALLRTQKTKKNRLVNLLYLLAGTSIFLVIAVIMSTIFHIGVVYWYVFLAATYGLISAYTMILSLAVIAVLIRMIRKFVI